MKKIVFSIVFAAVLWFVMFSPWTAPYLNFWVAMSCSAVLLSATVAVFSPSVYKKSIPGWKNFFLGAGIAVALWCVFWVGDKLSSMIFGFARPQVDLIYGIKEGISPYLLSALLLFLIGPAEEIFWRGYVQNSLTELKGGNFALIVTTAVYTLVHVPSLNFMLVMAAMTAGIVWGLLYRFFPERLPAIVVSHCLWDAAVFVWFPIM